MKPGEAVYWARSNTHGWGEGKTIEQAVGRAIRGGVKVKPNDRHLIEVHVFGLDQSKPVTHTSDIDGHALHRPAGTNGEADVYPYVRDAEGKVVPPLRFQYAKNISSEAGKNFVKVEVLQKPA